MNIHKKHIVLLKPRFKREARIGIGFNKDLLIKGPFCRSYFESYNERILFLFFSFITFGYYWLFLAKNGNLIKLIRDGHEPKDEDDKFILKYIVRYNPSYFSEGEIVRFSRTGSADDYSFK